MEKINANKTNLNKIIKWSTSKWNYYKKSEVIDEIIHRIKKNEDYSETFHTGSYTESGSLAGWKYEFEMVKNGKIILRDVFNKKTYTLLKK